MMNQRSIPIGKRQPLISDRLQIILYQVSILNPLMHRMVISWKPMVFSDRVHLFVYQNFWINQTNILTRHFYKKNRVLDLTMSFKCFVSITVSFMRTFYWWHLSPCAEQTVYHVPNLLINLFSTDRSRFLCCVRC